MRFLESDFPQVSVVVPVYNAELTVELTIAGLLGQDYPRSRFEIICVDNCSTDGTRHMLDSYAPHLQVLSAMTKGASAARNVGVLAANFDWIAFIDADCIPEKTWLSSLIKFAYGSSRADFIAGRIIANSTDYAAERFSETLFDQKKAIEVFKPPYAISANFLIRKFTILKYGLFDESFIRGQDVELSFRGYFHFDAIFGYAEDAQVRHINPRTVRQIYLKGLQHGSAIFAILSKYQTELGETSWHRCTNRKRYLEIGRGLIAVFKNAVFFVIMGFGENRLDNVNMAFFDIVFKAAKQLGLIRETFRHAIVSFRSANGKTVRD